jgi:hypothetical protein
MPEAQPYGYWTYGGKDGLYGAESTLQEQPDGSVLIVKNPDYPAVLEDDYILWAVRNDKAALRSFFQRLPTMDSVSQTRLNGLVSKYPAHFIEREDSTIMSDNLQKKQVRGKPLGPPRNVKPPPYPTTTETVSGGGSVSIRVPTSLAYMTTVTGLPSGLVWNGVVIRGTAPLTTGGSSYQIKITRTNSLGQSVGYLTLVITP